MEKLIQSAPCSSNQSGAGRTVPCSACLRWSGEAGLTGNCSCPVGEGDRARVVWLLGPSILPGPVGGSINPPTINNKWDPASVERDRTKQRNGVRETFVWVGLRDGKFVWMRRQEPQTHSSGVRCLSSNPFGVCSRNGEGGLPNAGTAEGSACRGAANTCLHGQARAEKAGEAFWKSHCCSPKETWKLASPHLDLNPTTRRVSTELSRDCSVATATTKIVSCWCAADGYEWRS